MPKITPKSATLRVAACCLTLLAVSLSSCGGGGGGGGSSGGGGASSSSNAPVNGTLSSINFTYQLRIKNIQSGQYLGIENQSQTSGARISQSTDTTGKHTHWHAIPMPDTQYNLENMLTNQVMGIMNASNDAGAEAVQWADNGTNDHLWQFYALGNNRYLIRNVKSGLYLQSDTTSLIKQSARNAACTCQEWEITQTTHAAYPLPLNVTGGGTAVHDPHMIQDAAGKFWLYGTHNTLSSSTDMINFTANTRAIDPDFAWWKTKNTTDTGGRTDLWAPGLLYDNGTYYHYYSIPIYQTPSNNTTNQGAQALIALATGPSPTGPWTDAGEIISSCGRTTGCTTTWNAIDPAPFIDADGRWWMTFGSWEDGLHILELDPATGLRLGTDMHNIAKRAAGIEGPFIFPHTVGGTQYYYYFASINVCCSGLNSRYRIVVGRSTSPTGPYLDRGGLDLKDGGGTILLSTHGNIHGPGGQSVLKTNDNKVVLTYHYYNGTENGFPRLGLNYLAFDADGWPYVE